MIHALLITGVVVLSLITIFFLYVFIVALKETIKEMKNPPPQGVSFDAGQKFSGELGVKLIKKGQPIPQ